MPIYEYVCRACGERFQKMRSMAERLSAPRCAACGGRDTSLSMSAPARVGAHSSGVTAGQGCGPDVGGCCGGMCMG